MSASTKKQRYLDLAQSAGTEVADAVFDDVSATCRQLWLASAR